MNVDKRTLFNRSITSRTEHTLRTGYLDVGASLYIGFTFTYQMVEENRLRDDHFLLIEQDGNNNLIFTCGFSSLYFHMRKK